MTTIADLSVMVGADIRELQSKMRQSQGEVDGFSQRASKAMGEARKMVLPVATGIAAIGGASLKAAIDFESDFANVIKTVDGTTEQLDGLKESIRGMATGTDLAALDNAHEQLTNIAATAGQLGVKTEDIEDFTRVVGGMTVATDLSAESAAVFAARFSNVTGMPITEIDNLADAIVTLGNNSAAQESEITAVANRLASMSGLNFDVDEILGYSAAVASLGLNPELGSTNLLKSVTDMTNAAAEGGPKLQAYADAVGMTADEFGTMVQNDPSDALNSLLESLQNMSADEALATLQDLGITSTEQQRTIMTLANGYDTVSASLATADEAFEGNGALMVEVGAKADTTAGKINKFENNVRDLGIAMGDYLLPAASKAADGLTKMVTGLREGDAVGAGVGFLDTLSAIFNFDVGAGLAGWVGAFYSMNEVVTLVVDDIERRVNIMALDVALAAGDAVKAITSIVPEDLLPEGFALDLDIRLAEANAQRNAYDTADRINDSVRAALNRGDNITLSDMVDLGEGLEVPLGQLTNSLFQNPETVSEVLKNNLGDAFAQAFETGDTGSIGQLMDLTQFMSFDPGELNTALQAAMQLALDTENVDLATYIYQAGIELDADVDLVKFNEDLQAIINKQKVKGTVSADITIRTTAVNGLQVESNQNSFAIPEFHDGGTFRSATGEGLALLRDGERVLNPEESRAYARGGNGSRTVHINYSSFGETPYNALTKLRSAAMDAGY